MVGRRRALPANRAVVGALLVAASLVTLFAAHLQAVADHRVPYVVASRDLAIGSVLTAGDLRTVRIDLRGTNGRAFRSPTLLVGATVLGPVAAGELIQASGVVKRRASVEARELSFPIERSSAVGGLLRPGEDVDVLATFGTGADSFTVTVVRRARVLRIDQGGGGFGDGQSQTVSLSVVTAADALAVGHAVHVGKVMLVRSGRATDGEPTSYRAPSPEP
ncbi:MAG TPA: Flp pilus assembly protein CpaB [Acidimicrobiales bacterium]|nr:Flp pilus assembly protein CpaB [Acidimicrobiales bacterium]